MYSKPGKLKRLTPAPRTTHWPPLLGLPYGLLRGLPYRLPPWDTLNKQPNLRLREKDIQEAYLLHLFAFRRLPRPSLFSFSPHFYTSSSATNENAVSTGKHCWISISLICFNCLPSTFAEKYKINLVHLFVMYGRHLSADVTKVQKSCFSVLFSKCQCRRQTL